MYVPYESLSRLSHKNYDAITKLQNTHKFAFILGQIRERNWNSFMRTQYKEKYEYPMKSRVLTCGVGTLSLSGSGKLLSSGAGTVLSSSRTSGRITSSGTGAVLLISSAGTISLSGTCMISATGAVSCSGTATFADWK